MENIDRFVPIEKHTIWYGTYRGMRFKIFKTDNKPGSYPDKDKWCGYVYVPARKMTEEHKKTFILPTVETETSPGRYWHSHDYMSLPGANGGPTYYDLLGEKGEHLDGRCAEIGWDYMHIWDDERFYDENHVRYDCTTVIDEVLKMAPEIEFFDKPKEVVV